MAYRCDEEGEYRERNIKKTPKLAILYGGSRGIRTPDFLRVKETL